MTSRFSSFKHATALITLYLIAGLFTAEPMQAQNSAAIINYYSGAEALFRLEPFPSELTWYMPFTGKTSQKTVMIRIEKNHGPARNIMLPVSSDGSFNYMCLMKDGSGAYSVFIFGSPSSESLNVAELCNFSVIVTGAVPDTLSQRFLNDKIVEFVNASMGKTIGRGECWDLVQRAL
ncbi:MAG TPA: hypothetical protein PLX41_12240, partial [Bacteroidales bacterium]|nr:hypothetical protein [Bacteroidales bacterium]